jgi:glycosyltransferase involved in cell wall biosynthesis
VRTEIILLPTNERRVNHNDKAKHKRKDPVPFNSGERLPTISVIIPTLNEAKNLPHVLPKVPSWVDEVILVDGHSKDDTVEVARRLCPDIRVVMQKGRGKGAALRTGFEAASGDVIVMLDADGSTDPGEIPRFILELLMGADFVKGSRFIQGGGTADMELYRKMGNWALVMFARLLFGGNFSDLCYGYNAFWSSALSKLDLSADGFEIETMMNLRALYSGLKVVEVLSFETPRVFGKSNLRTIPDGWRVLKTIFKEFVRWRGQELIPRLAQAQNLLGHNFDEAKELLVLETMHFVMNDSEDMSPEAVQETLGSLREAFIKFADLKDVDSRPSRKQQPLRNFKSPNAKVLTRAETMPKVPPFYTDLVANDY